MDPLDPILHQPLRTQIAAFLAGSGEASFNDLKRTLEVSDGNLDSHLKKMMASGYVAVRKDGGARPQSLFSLTAEGSAALHRYVAALHRLLPAVGEAAQGARQEENEATGFSSARPAFSR